jgi:hypothetical protein
VQLNLAAKPDPLHNNLSCSCHSGVFPGFPELPSGAAQEQNINTSSAESQIIFDSAEAETHFPPQPAPAEYPATESKVEFYGVPNTYACCPDQSPETLPCSDGV